MGVPSVMIAHVWPPAAIVAAPGDAAAVAVAGANAVPSTSNSNSGTVSFLTTIGRPSQVGRPEAMHLEVGTRRRFRRQTSSHDRRFAGGGTPAGRAVFRP